MRKHFLVAVIGLMLFGCDSKPEAPFGFKWGQSVNETLAQKLKGVEVDGEEDLLTFIKADSAPMPVQYSGLYRLVFTPSIGLTSITFSKRVDENSFFFNEGRTIYNGIAKKLEEKYGAPITVDEKVERDGAEFYSCIQEKSCGRWGRTYKQKDMVVKLTIEPSHGKLLSDIAKGYVEVEYKYFTEKMKNTMMEKIKKQEASNNF